MCYIPIQSKASRGLLVEFHFTSLPRAFLDRTFLRFEQQQQQSLLPRELAVSHLILRSLCWSRDSFEKADDWLSPRYANGCTRDFDHT